MNTSSTQDAAADLRVAINQYTIGDLDTILNGNIEWHNASALTKALGEFIAQPEIARQPLSALVHWLACSHATETMMDNRGIADSRINHITIATSLVSRILQAVEINNRTSHDRVGVSDTRGAAFQPQYTDAAARLSHAFVQFLRSRPTTEPSLLQNAIFDEEILRANPTELPPILPPEARQPESTDTAEVRRQPLRR
jgi:hypothetical protein